MLTVEERHAIVQLFENTVTAVRAHHCTSHNGDAIDRVLAGAIASETSQRIFYEFINSITNWGLHPAAHESAESSRTL